MKFYKLHGFNTQSGSVSVWPATLRLAQEPQVKLRHQAQSGKKINERIIFCDPHDLLKKATAHFRAEFQDNFLQVFKKPTDYAGFVVKCYDGTEYYVESEVHSPSSKKWYMVQWANTGGITKEIYVTTETILKYEDEATVMLWQDNNGVVWGAPFPSIVEASGVNGGSETTTELKYTSF